MAATLDIETIIPGHVLTTDGAILATYLRYLGEHLDAIRAAVRDGKSLEETLAALPLAEAYQAPADSPLGATRPVMQGFHRWNVKKTYQELSGAGS